MPAHSQAKGQQRWHGLQQKRCHHLQQQPTQHDKRVGAANRFFTGTTPATHRGSNLPTPVDLIQSSRSFRPLPGWQPPAWLVAQAEDPPHFNITNLKPQHPPCRSPCNRHPSRCHLPVLIHCTISCNVSRGGLSRGSGSCVNQSRASRDFSRMWALYTVRAACSNVSTRNLHVYNILPDDTQLACFLEPIDSCCRVRYAECPTACVCTV